MLTVLFIERQRIHDCICAWKLEGKKSPYEVHVNSWSHNWWLLLHRPSSMVAKLLFCLQISGSYQRDGLHAKHYWWPQITRISPTIAMECQIKQCSNVFNLCKKNLLSKGERGEPKSSMCYFSFSVHRKTENSGWTNFSLPWGSKGGGAMPLWGPSRRRGIWPAVFGQGNMFWATPWEKQRKERNGEDWLSRHVVPQWPTRLWDR